MIILSNHKYTILQVGGRKEIYNFHLIFHLFLLYVNVIKNVIENDGNFENKKKKILVIF